MLSFMKQNTGYGVKKKRKLKDYFFNEDKDDDDFINQECDDQGPQQNLNEPSSSSNNNNNTITEIPEEQLTEVRRSTRERKPPERYKDYETQNISLFCLLASSDPITYEEAIEDDKWKNAMDEEIASIQRNDTWELTSLPEGHNPIGVKCVYKTKTNKEGQVEKYKARLVAKGYK